MGFLLPQDGVAVSREAHNCDLPLVADWVEICAILSEDRVSQTEIVDILRDDEVYFDQEFAYEFSEQVWRILRGRQKLSASHYPFEVDSDGLAPIAVWKESLPYFFQLYVASLRWVRKYDNFEIKPTFAEQGELFEKLAEHAIRHSGWNVIRTGWSKTNISTVRQLVERVAAHLHDEALVDRIEAWFEDKTKELGLDLVASRPFVADKRSSIPSMLVQAASGANWADKLYTPDVKSWRRVVEFTADPLRAFCIPFALTEVELKRKSRSGLVMLDRTRLLSNLPQSDSVLDVWRAEATMWLEPQVKVLSQIVVS